jgi:hypothetical protein
MKTCVDCGTELSPKRRSPRCESCRKERQRDLQRGKRERRFLRKLASIESIYMKPARDRVLLHDELRLKMFVVLRKYETLVRRVVIDFMETHHIPVEVSGWTVVPQFELNDQNKDVTREIPVLESYAIDCLAPLVMKHDVEHITPGLVATTVKQGLIDVIRQSEEYIRPHGKKTTLRWSRDDPETRDPSDGDRSDPKAGTLWDPSTRRQVHPQREALVLVDRVRELEGVSTLVLFAFSGLITARMPEEDRRRLVEMSEWNDPDLVTATTDEVTEIISMRMDFQEPPLVVDPRDGEDRIDATIRTLVEEFDISGDAAREAVIEALALGPDELESEYGNSVEREDVARVNAQIGAELEEETA